MIGIKDYFQLFTFKALANRTGRAPLECGHRRMHARVNSVYAAKTLRATLSELAEDDGGRG